MILKLTLIISIIFTTQVAAANDYLVVNRSNKYVSEIDKEVVKDVFLGSKLFWEDGSRIQPVHLPINDKEFDTFLHNVVEMDTNQFLAYWRRKLFSGRAHPPKQMNRIEDILKYIQENPKSIGIIPVRPKKNTTGLLITPID